jgi:hypothetical protein|tara:strand:- start:1387 stop:1656 length:270 start_codon:yes stop_codon:yes gene_type:complete
MEIGDLVWQSRTPGGWCTILDIYEGPYFGKPEGAEMGWADVDYPVLKLAHPTEGIIEDASYYYVSVKDYRLEERTHTKYVREKVKNESR